MKKHMRTFVLAFALAFTFSLTSLGFAQSAQAGQLPTTPVEVEETEEPTTALEDIPAPIHDDGPDKGCG